MKGPSVFISYRRGPLADVMGRRLQHWLEQGLRASVYRDVTSIQIGVKFKEHLEGALSSCSLGLVLIDPNWTVSRLHQPDDWVRMEIEYMLRRRIPLAAVLIGGACRPSAEELPESLRPLLEHAVYQLDAGDEFDREIVPIGSFVGRHIPAQRPGPLAITLALLAGTVFSAGVSVAAYRVQESLLGMPSKTGIGESSSVTTPGSNDPQATLASAEPANTAAGAPAARSTSTAAGTVTPQPANAPTRGKPAPAASSPTVVDPGCSEVCSEEGRCKLVDGMLGQGCIAASEADCQKSNECKRAGLCGLVDRGCAARTDSDCSGSIFCSKGGQCRAHEGRCAALSNQDCLSASDCVDDGKCSRSAHGSCGYANDADCAKSRKCKERGACTHRNGSCLVTKDGDCRNSMDCKRAGLCKLGNGDCRPGSAKDCEQSTLCKERGECVVNEFGSACKRPPPASDTQASPAKVVADRTDGGPP